MRWLVGIVIAVVALAAGIGLGATIFDDDTGEPAEPPAAAEPTQTESETPLSDEERETCIAALDEAERDVEAERRATELLGDYRSVGGDTIDAVADLDTRRLEQLLTRIEALNERATELMDETTDAAPGALDTCRSLVGIDEV